MLTCSRCHQVIITDWETYTADNAGNLFHSYHVKPRSQIAFTVLALILLALIAFSAKAQEPKHVGMNCKGDRAITEHGSSRLGIRCSAVNLQGLPRRWTAYDAEDASKPFYTSFQDSFFFPAGEAWMVIELRVEDAIQTHYLRARARRRNGKPEMRPYTTD